MKAFFDKLERLFVAITFAEAGEAETARQWADSRPLAAAPAAQPIPAAGLAAGKTAGH